MQSETTFPNIARKLMDAVLLLAYLWPICYFVIHLSLEVILILTFIFLLVWTGVMARRDPFVVETPHRLLVLWCAGAAAFLLELVLLWVAGGPMFNNGPAAFWIAFTAVVSSLLSGVAMWSAMMKLRRPAD